MAITTNTQASAVVPEKWELMTLKHRYDNEVAAKRMKGATETNLTSGDIYHFPVEDELSTETLSAASMVFTPQTLDPEDKTVTVDQILSCSFEVSAVTQRQSNIDLKESYSPAMGKSIAQETDRLLLANTGSIAAGNIVGSADSPSSFDEDVAFAMLLKLSDAKLLSEKSNLSFFLPPIALLEGLYKKDRWTTADKTGMPKSVLTTGFEFPIMGVPIYTTNQLAKTGGASSPYKIILAHREWQGFVRQIKLDIREAERTSALVLSDVKVAWSLFGYGQLRSTYASLSYINSQSKVG